MPDGVVSVGQQKLDDVVDSTMFETSIQPNPPPATVGPRLKALLNDEPIDQSNSMESNDWFELEATQPQRSTELESNPEPIEVAHTHGHGTEEEDVVMQNAGEWRRERASTMEFELELVKTKLTFLPLAIPRRIN
jgi:hypothetical protein